MKFLSQLFLLVFVSFAALSCEKDEPQPQPEAWEVELEQLKSATQQYVDFSVAENEGRIDVSGYVPNMGHHYLNPGLSDGIFELEKPEIILYVPDDNGNMQMVAVEYSIVPDDPEQSWQSTRRIHR